jgi:hypothetical protein
MQHICFADIAMQLQIRERLGENFEQV